MTKACKLTSIAANIRLAVFDIDGVLTNGHVYIMPDGTQARTTHVRDGHGLVMLKRAGIATAVISGRAGGGVIQRLDELGVEHQYFSVKNKMACLDELQNQLGIDDAQTAFMGDDLPDIDVIRRCALGMAVADAEPAVLDAADWHSERNGGAGAVREACELILSAQGQAS